VHFLSWYFSKNAKFALFFIPIFINFCYRRLNHESESYSNTQYKDSSYVGLFAASSYKTLETKRRLGHYSVQWKDNALIIAGDDAPDHLSEQKDAQ
jgi:hypothetical protein